MTQFPHKQKEDFMEMEMNMSQEIPQGDGMAEEIEKCPFRCGGDERPDYVPYVVTERDTARPFYFVVCDNSDCEAQGPTDYDRDKAIEKWNRAA